MSWNNVLPSRAGVKEYVKQATSRACIFLAWLSFFSPDNIAPKNWIGLQFQKTVLLNFITDGCWNPFLTLKMLHSAFWNRKSANPTSSRLAYLTFSNTQLHNTSTVTADRYLHSWKSRIACTLPCHEHKWLLALRWIFLTFATMK